MSYKAQKRILVFTFLFFPMLLMLLFLVWPSVRMLFYSFTDWDGVVKEYNFIGVKNYIRVLTDPTLWLSLKNNMAYLLAGIVENVVALFFAVILSKKMRGREIYKTVIFLPYVLNITAIAYMFNFMYDYKEGPINLLMNAIGLAPIKFFSDPNIAIFSLTSMSLYRWLGYVMIIYIAALQSVEPELYESSSIDGANTWQTFWHISFPNIKRIIELQLFLCMSGSFQAFTETIILTKGGPGKATYTFLYYIIDTYVNFNSYGRAAAMSIVLGLVIALVALIQQLLLRSKKGDKIF